MELDKLTLDDIHWDISKTLNNRLWQPKPISFTARMSNGDYRKRPLSPSTRLRYVDAKEGSRDGLIFVFATSGSPIDKNMSIEIATPKIEDSLFLGREFLKAAFHHLTCSDGLIRLAGRVGLTDYPDQDDLFEGCYGAFS